MDRRAMLDEVIRLTAPARLEEDEFTVYDYMDHCEEQGLETPPINSAHRKLKKHYSWRKVLHDGRWTNAYKARREDEQRTDREQ